MGPLRLPALLCLAATLLPLGAQRIANTIDERARVTRPGNRHPMARQEFDAGPAPADTRMERMILLLEPAPERQEALEALLLAQQDPESPQYRQWLTPEEFGERFGAAPRDIERVAAWLENHGLTVEPVESARRHLLFSGTAAQVAAAFHTQIRSYMVNGERHYANARDPEIPVSLAPVVGGVVSLHDFHSRPLHHGLQPAFTSGTTHYLAPGDFATIYNVAPLYAAGTDGAGQSIAVAGRSNLRISDVRAFRSRFGLPGKDPSVIVNGADPGLVSGDEEFEAALDVQWAGAVARNATVQFVVSASTHATDGIMLSSQYIVTRNLAPVMSLSFGACEAYMGDAGNRFWSGLWQQAAAQGITVVVASGDSGAAGCDGASASTATQTAGVNGLCSTAYSTCVGGTQFSDTANPSAWWSATNAAGTYASALGYIPEAVWNSSGMVAGGSGLWSGGGGHSVVYAKPSWQTGAGVPSDGWRSVPDMSLNSSTHDGYLVALGGKFYVVGGTSAAAPAFAGLLGLVNQKTGARLGNINPALYSLAARQSSGGAAVFHDITSGHNSVPGVTGFSAGPGYDRATGLGSVDASQLVNAWSGGATSTPSFRLAANPAPLSLKQGSAATAVLTVTVSGGFNAQVALSTSALPSGLTATLSQANLAAPGAGTAILNLNADARMAAGNYTITVLANGGGLSQALALRVTVLANCTYTIDPLRASPPAGGGTYAVNVSAPSGCPWTAVSGAGWMVVTTGAAGNGNGTATYTVAANTATTSRTATLTVAGQVHTVSQAAAAAATYSLNPSSLSLPAGGGTGSVAVTVTPNSTSWTAVSQASWITITLGASGAGSRTVAFTAAANTTTATRAGTITMGKTTVTVSQAAAGATYALNPASLSLPAAGGIGGVAVTVTPAATSWTAVSRASWITITSGLSGTGSRTVTFKVAANTTATARTGAIALGTATFTVSQPAPACSYGISLGAVKKGATGYTGSVRVTAGATCSWTASSNAPWLTVTAGASGTGAGTVLYLAAYNTGTTSRAGVLTVAGYSITFTQGAATAKSLLRYSVKATPQ